MGVQHECAAFLDTLQHIVHLDIARIVTGDIIGRVNQIGRFDRLFPETQMRHGHAARLFGVIGKIGLGVHVGIVADDLNRGAVRADRAVRAKAPEFALHGAFGHHGIGLINLKRRIGHIVDNADRKAMSGLSSGHVVKHGLDHGRGEFLGAQSVASGKQPRTAAPFPYRPCTHPGTADLPARRAPWCGQAR